MAAKRRRSDEGDTNTTGESAPAPKKARKGFTVGPANLPDGTYKRRAQRIKKTLIQKAKLRKSYAKIKDREGAGNEKGNEVEEEVLLELHPDRQAMLEEPERAPERIVPAEYRGQQDGRGRKRKKTNPFAREEAEAEQKKTEAEERRAAWEEAEKVRRKRADENRRFRKIMAEAKSSRKDGKRKLGLESHVLLEKAKRIMGVSS
ncbi:MAG: hypothetical protein M1814_003438 [Vezdaea aestivalis]|nr:MAG: hypothetical protein M1814_003438 [Vezdaea aestivalis]